MAVGQAWELAGKRICIGFGQDPGQAGKSQALHLVRALSGFTATPAPEGGDKLTRFGPFSSQCRAGNVKLWRGSWNEELFRVLEGFPDLAHQSGKIYRANCTRVVTGATVNRIDAKSPP
jgi:predicted phage terminase large subunit-like protein